ncbi:uncharacterized protein LOC108704571 isoform X2 [Xenopus laevis]|uniref:Uncharacterized protein LOC108704571 isoform X2 n=1 Tax=Xenopus laevis TaxID=8355 RepID=A0A8J1MJI6_XENLA|nr:uncharacterized protein LOC108704571 isoform X2 [Xenopus laevis]XP_041441903.1 uncharacterized protein LOC108704571 isoform X2 [Xenopus laevis]XP_041441904.1 uncharacterized protein LOC108704571 isoform X2 [Xenopus laevis]
MGGWKVNVQLHSLGHITQHIPNSAYIGKDLICCSYPGQPHHCWKCGSTRHLSISCDVLKCAMCLGVGHVAKVCPQSIRCILCGTLGHAHGNCPSSWHKNDEFQAQTGDVPVEGEEVGIQDVPSVARGSPPSSLHTLVNVSLDDVVAPDFSVVSPVPPVSPILSFPGPSVSSPFRRSGICRGGKASRGRQVSVQGGSPPGPTVLGMISCSEGEHADIVGKKDPPVKRSRPQRSRKKTQRSDVMLSEWVQVGGKDGSPGVAQPSSGAHCISTSNKFSPLSWGERVEREEEIGMELGRMKADDFDADLSSDGSSGLEDISLEEAERLPLGLSAKRECSDDDRRIKKRAETATS